MFVSSKSSARLLRLGLFLVIASTMTLQGCSWFRRGGSAEDRSLIDTPADYSASGEGARVDTDAARPEDAPREIERPRSLRSAGDVMAVIYFDFDSSELRSDQLSRLDKNLQYLLDDGEVNVLVEGHCDERGTTEYNFALGERRAQSVKNYFTRNAVTPQRIQILSKGEEEPSVEGHSDAAWGKNRRVEFKFFN